MVSYSNLSSKAVIQILHLRNITEAQRLGAN